MFVVAFLKFTMSLLHLIFDSLILNWEIITLFFLIAILYSSVGFGGGSSYLAVLTLTALGFVQIRAIALLCNIVVVAGGSILYLKNGYFNFKKIFPLVLSSIPMAFLGGYIKISKTFFFVLLGITLLIASYLMYTSKKINLNNKLLTFQKSTAKDITYGGIIGFISGMVGIGGGIFLAPLLHLTNWDTPKRIAATTSFFILVNSIAGLTGQSLNPSFYIETYLTIILMVTVFIGGQIGSRISIKLISPHNLKKATSVLIALVSIRILWKYIFQIYFS